MVSSEREFTRLCLCCSKIRLAQHLPEGQPGAQSASTDEHLAIVEQVMEPAKEILSLGPDSGPKPPVMRHYNHESDFSRNSLQMDTRAWPICRRKARLLLDHLDFHIAFFKPGSSYGDQPVRDVNLLRPSCQPGNDLPLIVFDIRFSIRKVHAILPAPPIDPDVHSNVA